MSKQAKSILGRLKSVQSYEPQVCPIIVHGDSGAEGIYNYLIIF